MKVVSIANQISIRTYISPHVKRNKEKARKFVTGDASPVNIDL